LQKDDSSLYNDELGKNSYLIFE